MKHTASLSPDNLSFEAPENETILAAAKRQNLNLPHSCQGGICGQCKAQLLAGDVEQGPHSEMALSAEEQAGGKILLCCSSAKSDVLLKIAGYNGNDAPPVKTLPARVASVQFNGETAILTLSLPKAPPFQFWAGQYIDILLKDGLFRSYSIANSPAQEGLIELHIRRHENGLFSNMLFGEAPTIQEKSILRIRGPLGRFTVRDDSDAPLLFLATGTGFAPVQSLLQHLIDTASPRSVHVYWGARGMDDFYALPQINRLVAQLPAAQFTPVLSAPPSGWDGAQGYVQHQAASDYADLSNHEVYACGSPQMIEGAQALLQETRRLLPENFISDAFLPSA